jgi:hypothetical protein
MALPVVPNNLLQKINNHLVSFYRIKALTLFSSQERAENQENYLAMIPFKN